MKRKDILDALGQIDGKYLLETSPDRPYRRAVIQRVLLVAAIIALLAGALTLTTFALSEKPEPTSVETTTVKTSTPTPTPTPTETPAPSETITPTPTPTETLTPITTDPTTVDDNVIYASSLVTIKGLHPSSHWLFSIGTGFGIFEVREFTNEKRKIGFGDSFRLYTRLIIRVIYVQGYPKQDGSFDRESCDELIKRCEFWVPNVLAQEMQAGDVFICDLFAAKISTENGAKEIVIGAKGYNDECLPVSRFVDGKLVYSVPFNVIIGFEHFYTGLNRFQRFMDQGKTFEYYDLFERMPKSRTMDGATVEELIEVFQWFYELFERLIEDDLIDPSSLDDWMFR